MGRLPPRALASQRTLLLGGLLLPLALSSALREEVSDPPGDCSVGVCINIKPSDARVLPLGTYFHRFTTSMESPPSPRMLRRMLKHRIRNLRPWMISALQQAIPPGYEHFPGLGYYRLHTVPLDWFEAKATCEREGAHLAIINSQEEANLLKNVYNRDPKIGFVIHLGFHDLFQEGKFVTVFGQPLETTGYTTWDIGQPDNERGNDNCGSMFPSGRLNDINCASKQPFVCELPV